MVLTKCVDPPGSNTDQIVYNYGFIEDYATPAATSTVSHQSQSMQMTQHQPLLGPRGSVQSGSQSPTTTGPGQGSAVVSNGTLLSPDKYYAPDHPLSLMVHMYKNSLS